MSSVYVRNQITNFITTNLPLENFIDLDAQYGEIKEVIKREGVASDAPWLGINFIGDGEEPITVPATNTRGKYREIGGFVIHVVDIAKVGAKNSILTRAETVRNLFRGMRIGDIIIESMATPNFGEGASLNFEGGYIAAAFYVSYERDLDL